jgi:DNA-binding transcriptional LysR family regulator
MPSITVMLYGALGIDDRFDPALAPDSTDIIPLALGIDGKVRRMTLPAMLTVTGPETNVASACLGLGLIQVPRYRVSSEFASGSLVEVLTDFPPPPLPVHVLYSHARQLSPHPRVLMDWMAEQFREQLREPVNLPSSSNSACVAATIARASSMPTAVRRRLARFAR